MGCCTISGIRLGLSMRLECSTTWAQCSCPGGCQHSCCSILSFNFNSNISHDDMCTTCRWPKHQLLQFTICSSEMCASTGMGMLRALLPDRHGLSLAAVPHARQGQRRQAVHACAERHLVGRWPQAWPVQWRRHRCESAWWQAARQGCRPWQGWPAGRGQGAAAAPGGWPGVAVPASAPAPAACPPARGTVAGQAATPAWLAPPGLAGCGARRGLRAQGANLSRTQADRGR